MTETRSDPDRDLTAELRLRADPPRVVRLSKKALITLATAGSVGLAAAIAFAMTSRPAGRPPEDAPAATESRPSEALAALPKDYGAVPRAVPDLGPPLPGDLGEPILSAGQAGAVPPIGASAPPPPAVDPAVELRRQEREAARTSVLFFGTAATGSAAPAPGRDAGPAGSSAGGADPRTTSPERLARPASPYVVQAGAVIPAALVTGLRADLPGPVVAQVTAPVFDSPTGRWLLIPQGSRLIGTYDDEIGFGQSRVALAWTRLIFPDGRSIVLDDNPAADAQGYAGLQDGVNRHWGRLLASAALSTVLGVGAEIAADEEGDEGAGRAIRRALGDTSNQVGQAVVGRQLDVAPTLTVRPGHPLRVLVTRDLVLEPLNPRR